MPSPTPFTIICGTLLTTFGIFPLLAPFPIFLIVSLSPTYIHSISLAKIQGNITDPMTNLTLSIKIGVGPSGGCIWHDETIPPRCTASIPYVPDLSNLNLPNEMDLRSAFPMTAGRGLVMNHICVGLIGLSYMGIGIQLLMKDFPIWFGPITFTCLISLITCIIDSVYMKILQTRVLNLKGGGWEYHHGIGRDLILVFTFLMTGIFCSRFRFRQTQKKKENGESNELTNVPAV